MEIFNLYRTSALWHLPTLKHRNKMASPNEIPAPTKPLMAGCQQAPCCAPSMPPQRRLRLALQETIAAEESAQEETRGLREKNGSLTHKLDQVEIHLKAIQSGKFDAKECTAFLLREFFPHNVQEQQPAPTKNDEF